MRPPIDLDQLELLMDAVSSQGPFDARAYACREDGRLLLDVEGSEDVIPDNIEHDARYIAVPDKRDLDLGQSLVHDFVRLHMPSHVDTVRDLFRGRGGYRRFRDFLARCDMLERWYAFESERVIAALADWAEEHGFEVVRRPATQR